MAFFTNCSSPTFDLLGPPACRRHCICSLASLLPLYRTVRPPTALFARRRSRRGMLGSSDRRSKSAAVSSSRWPVRTVSQTAMFAHQVQLAATRTGLVEQHPSVSRNISTCDSTVPIQSRSHCPSWRKQIRLWSLRPISPTRPTTCSEIGASRLWPLRPAAVAARVLR